MGPRLLLILLVFNTFVIVSETLEYYYRFKVYPVDECPMNKTKFETAARRRNCTGNTRYLCAPDINLTSLIEFCTDQKRSLYGKDNCLKLEGTGNLNHYKCLHKFISGCPTMPYYDEDIYKYPACLSINRDLKCFVAEKDCLERYIATTEVYINGSTKENGENELYSEGGSNASVFLVVIPLLVMLIIVVMIGILVFCYKKRKIKKGIEEFHLYEEEKETMLDKKRQILDEQKLRAFLSKGELTFCHVRCIIVGCAGAGKTTLLKRLENVSFKKLKDVKSTKMFDVHVNSFEVLEDKETIRSVKEKNKLPTIIFSTNEIKNNNKITPAEKSQSSTRVWSDEIVQIEDNFKDNDQRKGLSSDEHERYHRNLKPEESMIDSIEFSEEIDSDSTGEGEGEQDKEEKDGNKDSREDTTKKNKLCSLSMHRGEVLKDDDDDDDDDDDETYAISKIIADVKKLSNKNLVRPRITFLDFAGQSLYYAFHQIYLSPKTCYILVVDLTKSFNDEVPEPDLDEMECSRFKTWKYLDYYKFWLNSIHRYGESYTPVVLVGTHADRLKTKVSNKFFRDFFELFRKNYPFLRKHLNFDRTFSIGFPKNGSKLKDLTDIKTCIAKLVRDPNNFKQIRPVWAIFEQILHRKKSKRIISRKELSKTNDKLNEALRMKEEEITNMLCFLHRTGTLLYFNEESLNDTIILDIQWFVNAFKIIIDFPVEIYDTDTSRERFKNTGLMYDNELTKIWKDKANEKYLFHKTNILSYMERLGLLAKCVPGDELCYYIPSMNKRRFEDNDKHKDWIQSSILCFQFDENGQMPFFPFYGVVLKCMQMPDWSTVRAKDEFCLYENVACLSFKHHNVVVCLCKFQLQIQVRVPKNGRIDLNVLKEIQQSIEAIMLHEFKGYVYDIGYKCQNGVLNFDDDNSFIAKAKFPVSKLDCDRCIVEEAHDVHNEVCWIPPERQENEDTQFTSEANEKTDEGMVSIKQIKEACLEGNIEHFTFHLEKEIGPRHDLLMRSDNNGWNVLHVAAEGGNLKIFRKLVSENLNICQKTHSQMTVLHIASKHGHYDICKSILENKDFKELVCDKSSVGKNACHYAAEAGSVKLLQLLVDNGIDKKAITNNKLNIFHIACIYNKLEMCKFIFDTYDDLVDAETYDGWTAALHAAKNGNKDFLEFLKSWKEVSLYHKSESDRNALHIACDNGHLETCKFLTEKCPYLLTAYDHKGRYPVHFAARSGNMKLLKYLESKIDMTMETYTGMNILHMACLHDHIGMCRYILDRYPDLNVKRSTNGWTTAHYVSGRGNNKGNEINIFKMLINATNPVEIRHLSKRGNSVLTLAIKYNVCEFAEYLFKNHRDMLNISDANNPWDTGNEHPKMLELLHAYLDKPRY